VISSARHPLVRAAFHRAGRFLIATALLAIACDSELPPINPAGADGIVNNRLLTGAEFGNLVISNKPLAFVTISARWCGTCRASAPAIEQAAEEFAGRVLFARLDYDNEKEIAERYEVRGVPTLLVFRGGKPVAKYEGPPDASDIRRILRPFLPPTSTNALPAAP